MISEQSLREIILYLNEHGEPATLKKYGFSLSTLKRYRRQARYDSTFIPRIVLFDIETSPAISYIWSLYNKHIPYEAIIQEPFCLGWSAKLLFDSEIKKDIVTPREALHHDDGRILRSLWKILNDSDVVIGHNSRMFDHKFANGRFLLNKMSPPMPYQTIDTLVEYRKHFRFLSNRLDYLGKLIFNKQKLKTDFSLWKKCLSGDQESLNYMCKYNQMDVLLLEEAYVEIRPWIKSHPNMGIYMQSTEPVCPNCGSVDIQDNGDYYTTQANRYNAYRCMNCGAPFRGRISDMTKPEKDNLMVPVAR